MKKVVGKKAFLTNQKRQYHVSNRGEQNCRANNKRNGVYYKYQSLCQFRDKLSLSGKWWKEKLFLQIKSINIMYPNKVNMIAVPKTKRMEIITSIEVLLISQINFDYNENGVKKSFSCESKAPISYILMWRTRL